MNVTVQEIASFYDRKTQGLLRRYGPGPRVHYHAGIMDGPVPPDASPEQIQAEIVASQERILRYAADRWQAASTMSGDLLDAGCGLGGGSLFWAQEVGARVTAVTLAPTHVDIVRRFAYQAGVADKVTPIVHDVTTLPGEDRFDAAVAFESSCHMHRGPLFERLRSLLRPGGRVFISDFFFVRENYRDLWATHWLAPLGSLEEYRTAAARAGFRELDMEDISSRTQRFWLLTAALIEAEARANGTSGAELAAVKESHRSHLMVFEGLTNGGLRHAVISFAKE